MAVAVIFTSQRLLDDVGRPVDDEAYRAANDAMMRLAEAQPGYLGITGARNVDGLGITVSYWRHEDDARAFGRLAAHREVQARARGRWYAWYRLEHAHVVTERTDRSAINTRLQ